MQNLELLKQQLIAQKDMLESKGITVDCAHTNPSPNELTTAISHISPVDMSLATVTSADVTTGKTFYDQTGTLQTGSFVDVNKALVDDFKNYYMPETLDSDAMYREYIYTNCDTHTKKAIVRSTITSLPDYTFYKSKIEEIDLPNGLVSMGTYCMDKCLNLKKLIMPDTLTTVQNYTFQELPNITELHISTSLTSLPVACLRYLQKVTEITIPENVTNIAGGNFQFINSCQNIYVKNANTVYATNGGFTQYPATLKVWLPFEGFMNFKTTAFWKHKPLLITTYNITNETTFPIPNNDENNASLLVWYSNLDDASARTNPLSAPNGAGTYYARIAT